MAPVGTGVESLGSGVGVGRGVGLGAGLGAGLGLGTGLGAGLGAEEDAKLGHQLQKSETGAGGGDCQSLCDRPAGGFIVHFRRP